MVFHLPEDPDVLYVKRVVGMPGEQVVIRDGAVWIDGRKLSMPQELRGLKFELDPIPEEMLTVWGTPKTPAQLDDGEYFVLGDFSLRARDSRLWQIGAPGHHAYAVPASYVVGVATHTYWPLSRCRSLRVAAEAE
jgi:signal peptidase I